MGRSGCLRIIGRQRRLALLYDAHHNRHLEDLGLWRDIAAQQGDPILELGCGTGRVLIPLVRSGYLVYGIDRNPAMLRVLMEKLNPMTGPIAHIMMSDLTAYRLAKEFSFILLPCNTFSTLSVVERRKCLDLVHRHLTRGGLFATSMPNPALLADLPERSEPELEEVFVDPQTDDPIQVSSEWERSGKRFLLKWYYDRLLDNGEVERTSVQTTHEINDSGVYLKELENSGLQPVGVYGDFDRSPYGPNSPNFIIMAER